MSKYKGMTIEDHQEYGKAIKEFREATMRLIGRFPKASFGSRAITRLVKAIDYGKAALEDEMVEQHRPLPPNIKAAQVYYGPLEEK